MRKLSVLLIVALILWSFISPQHFAGATSEVEVQDSSQVPDKQEVNIQSDDKANEDTLIESEDAKKDEIDSVEESVRESKSQAEEIHEENEVTVNKEELQNGKTIDKEEPQKNNIETESVSNKLNLSLVNKSKTSRLGHIRHENVKIYPNADNAEAFRAGSTYTNAVYYIKLQAKVNNEIYYLISKQPSSIKGVVGWVKASDLSTHNHTGVDRKAKTLYFKGTGSAYDTAWGGSKNLVYKDMSPYAGMQFKVDLTEKVGNNIWYRGQLNGKTIWLHSSYLKEVAEVDKKATSKLGHIRSNKVKIYSDDFSGSKQAGTTYTNAVYYIKAQTTYQGDTYYLISKQPSSTKGVVGWVKASDLSTHNHTGVDRKAKTLYFKGTGSAYDTAWGGSKNLVYKDMSPYAGMQFKVDLTEKVGNNIWYRGQLNGKTIWLHSSYLKEVAEVDKKATSKLGHIRSNKVKIYSDDFSGSKQAGTTYTNAVYYIKAQTTYQGDTYYLISKQPSSTKGVVGWVKASDLSTHNHTGVDRKAKTLYFKGTGSAYDTAWGGSKNLVYKDMSPYAGMQFKVDLTEKVGNNTWYRGQLNGKTIWLHSSYLRSEITISKLGHIRSSKVKIYNDNFSSSKQAGSTYTNAVYYIKAQTTYQGNTYYLISKQPSSTKGVVGWVKASDLSTHNHTGVDRKAKTLYFKGTGSAYDTAWGGSKNLVYKDMSPYAGMQFKVDLTEKVGNNIWYRGQLNGKTVWLHKSFIAADSIYYSRYNLTLEEAVKMQMALSTPPQTDKPYAYVSAKYINNKNEVTADVLNVRTGPATSKKVVGKLTRGTKVKVLSKIGDWYQIEFQGAGWVDASKNDVLYYLNPNNFINDTILRFQFLDLSKTSNASVTLLNNYLKGKGILEGKGQAFIDASRTHGISDIYLLSHALLETGNGRSDLANGIEVGKNKNGNLVLVTSKNRKELTQIKTTYNMYGYGAVDGDALKGGAFTAYREGWFTPEKAIIGGAKFIGNSYVKSGQNTLYKMRWNPSAMVAGKPSHQYATDVGWAVKQVYTMYNLYKDLGIINVRLDVPSYSSK
ncbi:GW dipeptide domain-containing protein [Cerasibacillus sp. JNUCC 74]